ncbi:MAG: SprT family zinc-dependent metalloprotease [Bacillota bacterium]|nr:SprT family zinc-dependent metalloprotease [Bacillota bacterium]
MAHVIIVGSAEINYRIKRSKRKTIALFVDPEEGVIVRAPERLTDRQIRKIVKEKSNWIIKKQEELKKIKNVNVKEFINGEKLPFLGQLYELEVIETVDTRGVLIALKDGKFQIKVFSNMKSYDRREEIKRKLIEWYKKEARTKYSERVEFYRKKLGVSYNKISIRDQKTRWGSCSNKGNLNFNWRLIMAPPSILDYIVVHELAHFIHANHGRDFWKLVENIIPDYREKREWLKINGYKLMNII